MSKTIEVELPSYLSIEHFYGLRNLNGPTKTTEKLVDVIELITKHPKEDILTWHSGDLPIILNHLNDIMVNTTPQYFPIIMIDDELYGFNPPSKMSLGEWIDLEDLIKDPQANLHKIMSILYRPITKQNWKNPLWKTRYNLKTLVLKETTNPFDVYEVEAYDHLKCKAREEQFKQFPLHMANGLLGFFLVYGMKYYQTIVASSKPNLQTQMEKLETMTMKSVFHNTMVGSLPYIGWLKHQYSKLVGEMPLQS